MNEIKKLSLEELKELRSQIRGKSADGDNQETHNDDGSDFYAEESRKSIEITVSEDRMSATAVVSDPGEDVYQFQEIMSFIRNRKIVVGIKPQAIFEIINNNIYDEPVVIAQGKPNVPSVEGYFEFFFDTEEHKTPEIREDGTADYSAVGRLANVKEGERIALYHPAIQGENGFDVYGNELISKIVKELPPLRGQYIRYDEETYEYFAKRDGKISINDNNIEILDVHEISGNVTVIQGKVEFFGDLYIHGDVENGVLIRAGRNVIVDGTVGAATIHAGGDIILQKGIQGAGAGKVSARGNIFSDFIEYSKVDAGMDVYANSIINSEISTYGSVVVSGSHGSIIGGDTHGLKGIVANAAGNANEVKTILHAGFLLEDYNTYMELNKSEKKSVDELEKLLVTISEMFKMNKTISEVQKQELLKLNEKKIEIQKTIDQIKDDKADISRKMSLGAGAAIIIRGDINRNVVICIDTAIKYILNKETFVKYICKNDEIERRTVPIG